ncbi:MAG: arginine transporter ATP-binding protein [Blastococcus sp.]|jgi:polar amino acid transport system ATP-binding protein|nr:arginine transporter ATP-binding protein [Blastococcus sp.]
MDLDESRNPGGPASLPPRPVVQFSGVSKAYGANVVLDDLDLDVAPAERVALIGPSGSGKTTILRVVAGLERPDTGTVLVDDMSVWSMELRGRTVPASERHLRMARSCTGMVFQQYNLFPHMTALANVTAPLIHVRQQPEEQARATATEMLDMVGLKAHMDKRPAQLSGGQQQRVALARALAMKPKVMLFDEVTSALDPEMVGEVLRVIRDVMTHQSMAMLIVTHEISFAQHVADRVLMFDSGRIVEQGPPDAVLRDPQHERTRRFLGALLDRG